MSDSSEKKLISPKQKRSIETKKLIKKVARRLFSDLGYYKVTTNTIAKTAGIPIGSFYNYYEGKEGVIIDLINEFNTGFREKLHSEILALSAHLNTRDDILPTIRKLVQFTLYNEQLADPFFMMFHALQFTEPQFSELFHKHRCIEINEIRLFLSEINRLIPVDSIEQKAELIHVASENLVIYFNHLAPKSSRESLLEQHARMIYSYISESDL